MPAPPRNRWLIGLAAAMLVAGWAIWHWWPRTAPAPAVVPWLNARPGVAYVGDAVCADCHHDSAEKFRPHPMGRSLAPVGNDEPASASFTSGGFQLSVARRDGKMVHAERLL